MRPLRVLAEVEEAVVEGDGGEVERTGDPAGGVKAAAEFVEGVLDGAVLGGVFVVDAEELGGVDRCGVGDAGPLADVDGDAGVGLEGKVGATRKKKGSGRRPWARGSRSVRRRA